MKVLMVCLGNICRSPLAEGILQQKAWQAGLNWSVESAGTEAYHVGEAPHKLSQKVAMLHGINISNQRSRKFVKEDLINFDKIYVMDSHNYSEVKRISKENWNVQKVDLLMNSATPLQNINVPDPWYGGEDGYHQVYAMIADACDAIIEQYKK
jgi:protein-tyrosine phosphatase